MTYPPGFFNAEAHLSFRSKRFSLVIMLLLCIALTAHSQQSSLWNFVPSEELNDRLPNWLSFSGEFRASCWNRFPLTEAMMTTSYPGFEST